MGGNDDELCERMRLLFYFFVVGTGMSHNAFRSDCGDYNTLSKIKKCCDGHVKGKADKGANIGYGHWYTAKNMSWFQWVEVEKCGLGSGWTKQKCDLSHVHNEMCLFCGFSCGRGAVTGSGKPEIGLENDENDVVGHDT